MAKLSEDSLLLVQHNFIFRLSFVPEEPQRGWPSAVMKVRATLSSHVSATPNEAPLSVHIISDIWMCKHIYFFKNSCSCTTESFQPKMSTLLLGYNAMDCSSVVKLKKKIKIKNGFLHLVSPLLVWGEVYMEVHFISPQLRLKCRGLKFLLACSTLNSPPWGKKEDSFREKRLKG